MDTARDDFLSQAVAQRQRFQALHDAAAHQRDEIDRQLTVLAAHIAEADAAIRFYKRVMGIAIAAPESLNGVPADAGGKYADLIVEILGDAGGSMDAREIQLALNRRLGREVSYGSVYSALTRDERIAKVRRGVFGLAKSELSSPDDEKEVQIDLTDV